MMLNQDKQEWLKALGVRPESLAMLESQDAAVAPSGSAAAGTGAAGALPQPMQRDCSPVHGKVPSGPANHLLCSKHGHVVDIKTGMVIAHSLDEYTKQAAPAKSASPRAAAGNVKTLDFGDDAMEIVVRPQGSSMRLPEQTPRDKAELEKQHQQAAAHAKAEAARVDHDVHDPAFVEGIITRIRTNCNNFSLIIIGACDDFAGYAGSKVKEFKQFKKAVAPLDLFGTALEILLGVVSGKLGDEVGKVLSKAGEELKLAEHIATCTADAAKGGILKKLEAEDDSVEALEAGITLITTNAKKAGEAVSQAAYDTIDTRLSAIAESMKSSGKGPSDADVALLNDFAEHSFDEALEGLGVPSAKSAQALRPIILKRMIKEFEMKRIVAVHEALGDFPGKEALSDNAVKSTAESNARAAMGEK